MIFGTLVVLDKEVSRLTNPGPIRVFLPTFPRTPNRWQREAGLVEIALRDIARGVFRVVATTRGEIGTVGPSPVKAWANPSVMSHRIAGAGGHHSAQLPTRQKRKDFLKGNV